MPSAENGNEGRELGNDGGVTSVCSAPQTGQGVAEAVGPSARHSCPLMQRTIVVRRDYLKFVPKYRRYEKRHTNTSARRITAWAHAN